VSTALMSAAARETQQAQNVRFVQSSTPHAELERIAGAVAAAAEAAEAAQAAEAAAFARAQKLSEREYAVRATGRAKNGAAIMQRASAAAEAAAGAGAAPAAAAAAAAKEAAV